MSVASWLADLTDLLLPAGCVACGAWLPESSAGSLVCGRCRTRLRTPPWPRCPRCHHPSGTGRNPPERCRECAGWPEALAAARYAYVLEPPASDLVHALKYGGWSELADDMGTTMAGLDLPIPEGPHGPVVVPVPTTPERMRKRGYNQAELLARSLARKRGWTLTNALGRTGGVATQVGLHPLQRKANVKGAFCAREGGSLPVRERQVVLVDDVLTTGATAGAAAATLVRMGARAVTLVAFARALPFRHRPS